MRSSNMHRLMSCQVNVPNEAYSFATQSWSYNPACVYVPSKKARQLCTVFCKFKLWPNDHVF
jgi:hypothetical protein